MTSPPSSTGTPRIIAVGGGKGGIGKSLCSASLAVAMGRAGHRVTVVDADLGGANVHTCLGVPPPPRTLGDFVNHRVESLGDVLVQTAVPGVTLVAGASDLLESGNPTHTQRQRLVRHLLKLPADQVILDLGAGTSLATMDFFLLADHPVMVIIPEPTSIENAYRFLKAAYLRRFRTALKVYGVADLIDEAVKQPDQMGIRTPRDLLDLIARQDAPAAAALGAEMSRLRVRLLVNQVREDVDQKVGEQFRMACQRYFGLTVDVLGTIPHEDAVWKSVRARQPLMVAAPDCAAALAFTRVAERLLALPTAADGTSTQG